MTAFTSQQQAEIANLVRRETDRYGTLIRQLQQPAAQVQIGDPFPTCQQGASIAARTDALPADGTTRLETEFPELYTAIGIQYNIGGEPAGSFRLPDMRGRTLIGSGTGTGLSTRTVGDYGGGQDAKVIAHNHAGVTGAAGNHTHGLTDVGGGGTFNIDFLNEANAAGGVGHYTRGGGGPDVIEVDAVGTHVHGIATDGVSGTGENMMPFVVVTWLIRAR